MLLVCFRRAGEMDMLQLKGSLALKNRLTGLMAGRLPRLLTDRLTDICYPSVMLLVSFQYPSGVQVKMQCDSVPPLTEICYPSGILPACRQDEHFATQQVC